MSAALMCCIQAALVEDGCQHRHSDDEEDEEVDKGRWSLDSRVIQRLIVECCGNSDKDEERQWSRTGRIAASLSNRVEIEGNMEPEYHLIGNVQLTECENGERQRTVKEKATEISNEERELKNGSSWAAITCLLTEVQVKWLVCCVTVSTSIVIGCRSRIFQGKVLACYQVA